MKIGTTGFVGERLTEAREARGISAASLAEILGLTSATISQYEHGRQTPRPEVMEAISKCLNLPVSFFLRPSDYDRCENIFFRSWSSTVKGPRTKASRRFKWLKDITEYVQQYFDLPVLNLPEFNVSADPTKITYQRIEEIALACRDYLNLGDGPIADLILVLENNGAIVSRALLEEDSINAFSQWSKGVPYAFLTADKESAVRSRLDAAHELGHLLLHRNFTGKLSSGPLHKLIEDQAFYFASVLLLPTKAFSSELWAPTLDAFHSMKPRWKVSIGMMIKRCEELGITTEEQSRRLWINYNRRGWRTHEPLDEKIRPEEPCLLRKSFEMMVENKIKTNEQILLDLCLSHTDIEQLANLPHGFLTDRGPEIMIFPKTKTEIRGKTGSGTILEFSSKKYD